MEIEFFFLQINVPFFTLFLLHKLHNVAHNSGGSNIYFHKIVIINPSPTPEKEKPQLPSNSTLP